MTILKDPDGKSLYVEGRLEGISVPDLVRTICMPGWSGTLTLWRGEVTKTVYIKGGQMVFAASTLAEDRLGEILLRSGVISYGQLDEAVTYLGSGKRLGSILVELGHLEPSDLVRGLLSQVKEIILSLFKWEWGAYRFVEGPLPTTEVITLNMSTSRLLLEGVRRITAWPRIARGVGTSRTVYRVTREGPALAEELDLGATERAILHALSEPATVAEICSNVFLGNFEVYQYLWTFRILGIIREIERVADDKDMDPYSGPFEGSLTETSFAQLLLRLCGAGETGLLHVARDGEEKSIHLKEGVVAFATSNRQDEALTNFLLRRGIIGLREKEEVERRLLSNKRAGAILCELGILSRDELVPFVRDQLMEIVLSLFTWNRGEWRFVSGELPTLEEITIGRSAAELVLRGVRGVRDWGTVRGGCGELGTVLGVTESLGQVLAGIDLAPEEGEVLDQARSPRTVAEICAATEVSDFRVCQILWAFQLLGAVSRIQPTERAELPVGASARQWAEGAFESAVAHEPAVLGSGVSHMSAGRAVTGEPFDHASTSAAAREPGGRRESATLSRDAVYEEAPSGSVAGERSEAQRGTSSALEAGRMAWTGEEEPERWTPSGGQGGADASPEPMTEAVEENPDASAAGGSARAPASGGEAGASGGPLEFRSRESSGTMAASGERDEEAGEEARGPSSDAASDGGAPGASMEEGGRAFEGPPTQGAGEREEALDGGRGREDEWLAGTSLGDGSAERVAVEREGGREDGNGHRGIVTTALRAPEQDATMEDPRPPRTPIEAVGTGVLEEIERFNRRHREVYAVLKGAVGAGVRNFVGTCVRRLTPDSGAFHELAPDETGAFPAETLFERLGSLPPMEIRSRLESLIVSESAYAEVFLDPQTLQKLSKRLETATWDAESRA